MSYGGIAGAFWAQVATRESTNGLPMGQITTPDSPSTGTTSHAYLIRHLVSASAPQLTRAVATFRGGMKILGQRSLGVESIENGEIELAAYDETLAALANKSTVDTTTASGNSITAPNLNQADPRQLVMALTMGFTDLSTNTNKYATMFVPNAQLELQAPGLNQDGGVNPSLVTGTIVPQRSTNAGFGFLFSNTSLAVVDNTDLYTIVVADYPIGLTTYVAEAAATTFTVGYVPALNDVDGSKNMWSINGADGASDVSAFSASTGAVTISSATASDIYVAAYQTNFVSL